MKNNADSSKQLRAKHIRGFKSPTGITFDHTGNMYVANWSGGNVTKVGPKGDSALFVSVPGSPSGLAYGPDGHIFVSDYSSDVIYRVSPSGEKSVYASGFKTPAGISFNKEGELLVANRRANEIVKVTRNCCIVKVASGFQTPVGVVEHLNGDLFVSNYDGGISRITHDGRVETISTEFVTPGVGIIVADGGSLLVVDHGQGTIKSMRPDGKSIRTVARNLKGPVGLAFNSLGALFVTTWGDDSVHCISLS